MIQSLICIINDSIYEELWTNFIGGSGSATLYNQMTNGPVNAHLISGPIRFLKVFTINKHGGHLGHVTCTFAASFPQLNDFVTVSPFKRTGDPI